MYTIIIIFLFSPSIYLYKECLGVILLILMYLYNI